jgi:glycosyltransferase involved in cell wall biosynthesis
MKYPGWNCFGYMSSNSGLGVAVRALVQLILNKQCPVALYDFELGFGRSGVDKRYDAHIVKSADELPHNLNLVCIALHDIPEFVLQPPAVLLNKDAFNIVFVFWELPTLPKIVVETIQFFDAVITVSDFVRYTVDNEVPNIFSLRANYPLVWPDGVVASRSRFGLPADSVVFITSFDPYSDLARKNPLAVIEAFQNAFPQGENVNLVMKLNSAREGDIPALKSLEVRCAADPRIRFFSEALAYVDVLSLYASCDVFVSLHRAEGLGLGLMEAMTLGKPTIATGWSGNMSFMNSLNACLVRYKLVPPEGTLWVYHKKFLGRETVWADPDIQDATRWMKRLAGDQRLRERIGEKAKNDMRAYQEVANKGELIDEIVTIHRQQRFGQTVARDRQHELQQLRKKVWRQQSSYSRRIALALREQVDRHISWRFQTRS